MMNERIPFTLRRQLQMNSPASFTTRLEKNSQRRIWSSFDTSASAIVTRFLWNDCGAEHQKRQFDCCSLSTADRSNIQVPTDVLRINQKSLSFV